VCVLQSGTALLTMCISENVSFCNISHAIIETTGRSAHGNCHITNQDLALSHFTLTDYNYTATMLWTITHLDDAPQQ
jgi:hypothetical protein